MIIIHSLETRRVLFTFSDSPSSSTILVLGFICFTWYFQTEIGPFVIST